MSLQQQKHPFATPFSQELLRYLQQALASGRLSSLSPEARAANDNASQLQQLLAARNPTAQIAAHCDTTNGTNDTNSNSATTVTPQQNNVPQFPFGQLSAFYAPRPPHPIAHSTPIVQQQTPDMVNTPSSIGSSSNFTPNTSTSQSENTSNGSNGAYEQHQLLSPVAGDEASDGVAKRRRPRVGGTSNKTAEVWRFFTQLPAPEQAATCMICKKVIKATNSSTTGMIRHLRSCHNPEFEILQRARFEKSLRNDEAMRERFLKDFNLAQSGQSNNSSFTLSSSSIDAVQTALELNNCAGGAITDGTSSPGGANSQQPRHTVESIIGGGESEVAGGSIRPLLIQQLNTYERDFYKQHIKDFKKNPTTKAVTVSESKSVKRECASSFSSSSPAALVAKRPASTKSEPSCPGDEDEVVDVVTHVEFNGKRARVMKEEPRETTVVDDGALDQKEPQQQTTNIVVKKNRKTKLPTTPTNISPSLQHWPSDHHEAKQISDQIAAMVIVDKTENILGLNGFRSFIQWVYPEYQMPDATIFRSEIIPRVSKKLRELHLNNPLAQTIINGLDRSGVSPATTVESGFLDDREDIENYQHSSPSGRINRRKQSYDELLQNSIRSQNISSEFSYSIELNHSNELGERKELEDSDTSSSVCSEVAQSKIDEFLMALGKEIIFPKDQVSVLLHRCYAIYTSFEECASLRDCLVEMLGLGVTGESLHMETLCVTGGGEVPELSLGKCLTFVDLHYSNIEKVNEQSSIPHFQAFSTDERGLIANLRSHYQAQN